MSSPSPASPSAAPASKEVEALSLCSSMVRLAAEAKESWSVLERSKDGVTIRQGSGEHSHTVFGEGEVDAPMELVMELLLDMNLKKKYDDMFDKAIVIEEFSPTLHIMRHCYLAPMFVGKRDLCMLMQVAKLEDGTLVLAAKSTTHKDCPENPKYVRADLKQGGWLLRRDPAAPTERTLLTFVSSTDLKGSLPTSLTQRLARLQPAVIGRIRPVLQTRMKELAEMDPKQRDKIMHDLQANIAQLTTYTDVDMKSA